MGWFFGKVATAWNWVLTSVVLGLFALLVGALSVVILVLTIPVTLFYMLFRRNTFDVPPEVMAEYEEMVEALEAGDIGFLNARLAEDPALVNGVDGFIERRWLTNAIDLGAPETVAWFLDQGADVNFRDDEGFCPLDSAIQRDNDLGIRRRTDPTLSAESGAVEVLTMLLDGGADVNLPDVVESTPLHFAAVHGSPEVVQLLLERGADPLAYDAEYVPETPIHRAQATKRYEIAEQMKAHANRDAKPD